MLSTLFDVDDDDGKNDGENNEKVVSFVTELATCDDSQVKDCWCKIYEYSYDSKCSIVLSIFILRAVLWYQYSYLIQIFYT